MEVLYISTSFLMIHSHEQTTTNLWVWSRVIWFSSPGHLNYILQADVDWVKTQSTNWVEADVMCSSSLTIDICYNVPHLYSENDLLRSPGTPDKIHMYQQHLSTIPYILLEPWPEGKEGSDNHRSVEACRRVYSRGLVENTGLWCVGER